MGKHERLALHGRREACPGVALQRDLGVEAVDVRRGRDVERAVHEADVMSRATAISPRSPAPASRWSLPASNVCHRSRQRLPSTPRASPLALNSAKLAPGFV